VEDWNWETIFTDIIGLYSTTVTYLASKAIELGEKRKIRAITPFKVIQGQYPFGLCLCASAENFLMTAEAILIHIELQ